MSTPTIIPVLDIMGGVVVRGVAGRREEYRPIQSRWCPNVEPVPIAQALRQAFGLSEFYVADLDGIRYGRQQLEIIQELAGLGLTLAVDAGLYEPSAVERLLRSGATRVVIGLETLNQLESVSTLLHQFGDESIVFSLDLKCGSMLGIAAGNLTPLQVVEQLVGSGLRRLIVLDLAGVGMGAGIPTLELCRAIHRHHPAVILWTGGGVRNTADIQLAAAAGVAGVLIASALHDGRIRPA